MKDVPLSIIGMWVGAVWPFENLTQLFLSILWIPAPKIIVPQEYQCPDTSSSSLGKEIPLENVILILK